MPETRARRGVSPMRRQRQQLQALRKDLAVAAGLIAELRGEGWAVEELPAGHFKAVSGERSLYGSLQLIRSRSRFSEPPQRRPRPRRKPAATPLERLEQVDTP
jgi:hypothetical protein